MTIYTISIQGIFFYWHVVLEGERKRGHVMSPIFPTDEKIFSQTHHPVFTAFYDWIVTQTH